MATSRPWTTEAAIVTHSICHAKFATRAAAMSPIGIAYFAGQRKPMRRTPASRIGVSARSAATARLSIVVPIRGDAATGRGAAVGTASGVIFARTDVPGQGCSPLAEAG